MPERLRHLRNRILYPPDQLGKGILRNVVAPSALLALGAALQNIRPAEAKFFTKLGIEIADSPSDLSKKMQSLAIPGLVGGGLLFGVFCCLEWRNRILYGDLAVSQVAVDDKYIPRRIFRKELANEIFVGELHFQGKWKKRFSKEKDASVKKRDDPVKVMRLLFRDLYALTQAAETNDPIQGIWKMLFTKDKEAPVKVMRMAFHDLYALAVAVENNDPRLADFNYFVGVSSMVDDLFKKFGFKVAFYKNELGLPALGQPDQNDLKLIWRPVNVLLFDKETLVANKAKLAKSAHIRS